MSLEEVTRILQGGIYEIFLLAGPFLISALVIGLVVAILQATTSIQEQTLTFVPKMAVILVVLFIFGGFMFGSLADYTKELFRQISQMAR